MKASELLSLLSKLDYNWLKTGSSLAVASNGGLVSTAQSPMFLAMDCLSAGKILPMDFEVMYMALWADYSLVQCPYDGTEIRVFRNADITRHCSYNVTLSKFLGRHVWGMPYSGKCAITAGFLISTKASELRFTVIDDPADEKGG